MINPRSTIERKNEYKKTIIRQGATIGANATIICGNSIGAYAMIGAGAVVVSDVADYALIVGNPGVQIGWISRAGIRLNFENSKAKCHESKESYTLSNGKVKYN